MTKLEAILAAVAACLIALLVWSYHERVEGAAKLKLADAQALVVAEQKAAAQTVTMQAQVNDYIAAHPVPVVRVCSVPPRRAVSKTTHVARRAKGPSPAAAIVPAVPTRSAGPDIGPGLTILVQAAARLAVLQHESQLAQ